MSISKNRVKVEGVGGDTVTSFALGTPVAGFTSFPNGLVKYAVLAATGEWQIGSGTVTGSTLTRGTVEENYLGDTTQIDFTGKDIQIAQVLSVDFINSITDKLDGIESGATQDQIASEVVSTGTATMAPLNVQGALENLDGRINAHNQNANTVVYDPASDDVSIATDIQTAMENHAAKITDMDAKTFKHISVTAPVDPVDGQEWINPDTMLEYTWYVGTLNSQWVRNS